MSGWRRSGVTNLKNDKDCGLAAQTNPDGAALDNAAAREQLTRLEKQILGNDQRIKAIREILLSLPGLEWAGYGDALCQPLAEVRSQKRIYAGILDNPRDAASFARTEIETQKQVIGNLAILLAQFGTTLPFLQGHTLVSVEVITPGDNEITIIKGAAEKKLRQSIFELANFERTGNQTNDTNTLTRILGMHRSEFGLQVWTLHPLQILSELAAQAEISLECGKRLGLDEENPDALNYMVYILEPKLWRMIVREILSYPT